MQLFLLALIIGRPGLVVAINAKRLLGRVRVCNRNSLIAIHLWGARVSTSSLPAAARSFGPGKYQPPKINSTGQ